MGGFRVVFMSMALYLVLFSFESCEAAISRDVNRIIKRINKGGPYTGVLVARRSELQPLIDSKVFRLNGKIGQMDFGGRKFQVGHIGDRKMILATTGKGMINAAITTQLLCTLFKIKNILHYGLAGNADENLNLGDVTIPQYWAHTGLWNWQRYGEGPDDELSFEDKGYFTRDYGYLNFGDYTNKTAAVDDEDAPDNFLNNIWYQPEEIFPTEGSNIGAVHTMFWVPVDPRSYEIAKTLEVMKLEECIGISTCLPNTPKVVTVNKGSSASIYLDNVAYKSFLNSKFEVSPVDMEGAAIALISHQLKIPFVAFKALHDFAGQGDDQTSSKKLITRKGDDSKDMFNLLIENCIQVIIQFILKYRAPKDMIVATADE